MLYVTADGRAGELACASAGHPSPRLVRATGAVEPLGVRGLALGIAGGQAYEVERVTLAPGDAAVLFTDGLLEARREGELYGEERLDASLARHAALPAEELAVALVEDCRAYRRRARGRLRGRRPQAHVIDLSRRDGRPLRIGHRGAAALAPENSLEAIGLAVELGCDLVEFDVHALGETLVVAHDPPGTANGLPTLDDVLELLGPTDAGVHLDLKAQGAERPVAEALRRHGLVERTVVSSFRRPTLLALHAVEPGLRLGRTYPQDRTGLTKRRVFHPPARAIVRVLRRTLPARIAGLLSASRATAAVLYWEVLSEEAVAALPCARRAGARLDGGRRGAAALAGRNRRGRRDHERSAHLS